MLVQALAAAVEAAQYNQAVAQVAMWAAKNQRENEQCLAALAVAKEIAAGVEKAHQQALAAAA